jgi:uncharacterized membrane protein YfcA
MHDSWSVIHTIIFIGLGVMTVVIVTALLRASKRHPFSMPKPLEIAIGFVTNFFDTLGIGSFAPTTSMFKFWKVVPDERIPGTLNVGHTLPTILEAFALIAIVRVDPKTLVSLIIASVAGAYLGAGVVARWPRRYVQTGMGFALLAAAVLFLMKNLNWIPGGGEALGVSGGLLIFAIFANFCLGALMTIGIGLYAPAMILITLLGMDPKAAFPIMMGSCAFLMPIASLRFIKFDSFSIRASLGLTLGGLPGVAIAAFLIKGMSIVTVRWLVIVVVIYAAVVMLRSAMVERKQPLAPSDYAATPP